MLGVSNESGAGRGPGRTSSHSCSSWLGQKREDRACVRDVAPSESELQLNLVLEPELRQPLEVELLTDPAQTTDAQRHALLARLVELDLCSAEKAELLRSATARTQHDPTGISWYVKLRIQDNRLSSAKAYVGITPRRSWATS